MTDISVCVNGPIRPNGIIIICNIINNSECDYNYKISDLWSTISLKVLESYFSFLFLMQKSILYAKIAISQKTIFQIQF